MPALRLDELALKLGGEAVGPSDLVIEGVSGYESAGESDVTFVDNPRVLPAAERSRAAALIVSQDVESSTKPLIRTANPRVAFARALEVFHPRRRPLPGIDAAAVVGAEVAVGHGVYIGPHAVIADGARLGNGVEVHALTHIGENAEVGDDTIIYPGVVVYHDVRVGKRCIIHAGCVIGADGFGFVRGEQGEHIKVPQVGTVIIEDDVEMGANCCVDRATTDATIVGRGTKFDNLVQVGHNVKIGRNCIIVAQVGLSGSVEIGDGAVLAGQVGIADHITIGKEAIVCAQAGVMGNVPERAMYSGYPARPHREQMRVEAAVRKLPEALVELRKLRRQLEAIEERLKEDRKD